jgi:hypothetical protein
MNDKVVERITFREALEADALDLVPRQAARLGARQHRKQVKGAQLSFYIGARATATGWA